MSGYQGNVRNISVRSTEIQTFDHSTVIVPNADLITGSMTNFTHSSLRGRVIVKIGVGYDSDPEQVMALLAEIAAEHPMVLKSPAPSVLFTGFGDSAMDFEIRAIIRDVNNLLRVKSDLNLAIANVFKKAKVEIPFPQREVLIKNADQPAPKPKGKVNS